MSKRKPDYFEKMVKMNKAWVRPNKKRIQKEDAQILEAIKQYKGTQCLMPTQPSSSC